MKHHGSETIRINVLCAVIAGSVSSAIANPTDVLKVRMQVDGSSGNISLFACFKNVYMQEGISGLWRVSTNSFYKIMQLLFIKHKIHRSFTFKISWLL